MKKFILTSFVALSLSTTLISFKPKPLKDNLEINSNSKEYFQNNIEAYILSSGTWHYGFIGIRRGDNGYELTEYQFKEIGTGYREFVSPENANNYRIIRLNPNNQLAIKYNITHYVTIQGYTVYFILN